MVVKVLVVDAGMVSPGALEASLRAAHPLWTLRWAHSLAELPPRATLESFDLLLVGQRLPDGDAMSMIERFRGRPAIVMVPRGAEAFAADALAAGFSDYVICDDGGGYLTVLPAQCESALRQMRVRQTLQESLTRNDLVLGAAGLGWWDEDLIAPSLHFDARACALLGEPAGAIDLDAFGERMHAADALRVEHEWQLIHRGDLAEFDAEFRLRHRDGHWVWVHCRGRVVERSMDGLPRRVVGVLSDVSARKAAELDAERKHRLLQAVSRAQSLFISDVRAHGVFTDLLEELLAVTDSEYGLVGEVVYREQQPPALWIHAITNIAWDEASHAFFEAASSKGVLFDFPSSLVGHVLSGEQPLFCNDPASDPRSTGVPAGHPPMHSFMGLPVSVEGRMVAMVGLSNQPGGYHPEDAEFLAPLLSAIGQIFQARQVDKARRALEQDLQVTLQSMGQGLLRTDEGGHIAFYNQRLLQLLGLPAQALEGRPRLAEVELFGPDAAGQPCAFLPPPDAAAGAVAPESGEVLWRRAANGRALEVRTRTLDDGGQILTFLDVSAFVAANSALRDSEARARGLAGRLETLLGAMPDPMFEVDASGVFRYVSSTRPELLIREATDMIGHSYHEFLPPEVAALHDQALAEAQRRGVSTGRQFELQLADGPHWFELAVSRKPAEADEDSRFVMLARDISERKRAEEEIERLAFHDVLTGLPNRRLLLDRLAMALVSAARSNQHGALFFIDLDNFKDLNDTLGHDLGDMLLQQVAMRLQGVVRGADTVARLGGDEFVVMLEELHQDAAHAAADAEAIGRKILSTLNLPYGLPGRTHNSTPSIGVALFGHGKDTVDELLKRADLAMYQAKVEGRNTLRFFDPEMQNSVLERATLEADLRVGLETDELLLHFQPVVDHRGEVVGAEALVRWRHPVRGMVSPAAFIPVAEQTGLIVPLGRWVLRTACETLADWQQDAQRAHLSLAVNISAPEFRDREFVPFVRETLQRTGIAPERLKIELTESMFMLDAGEIARKMSELKEQGVAFSLDDFGTGYSSLSYLKRLPLDQLKIDQSFVRDLLVDAEDAAIVRAILTLAHSLDLHVVAEGVETLGQFEFLAAHGCRAFQGYLFGRPDAVLSLDTASRLAQA